MRNAPEENPRGRALRPQWSMVADRRRNRWFVDSPLERNGFELPVPRENGYRSESSGFVYLPETVRVSSKDLPTSGTEVSNPLPLQQRVERTTIAWSPP